MTIYEYAYVANLEYQLKDAAAAIVDVVIAEDEYPHAVNLNQARRRYRAVKAKLDAAKKEAAK